ncbi:hypothetical protein A2334_01495 [Candidatus Roizmanbacteria bacterium RIFOXYB2_FULL_38_10]|uniref:FCP1 homology domain-containing protein n=1 Tax=Candidatus Roizmanbacteria bacterium RIFOXYD1_FULL_38_12 TaxID=1802093 RepID=A0A1F7L2E6_9BACT|nr:MAG: hypothetical protein A3K47_05565 [Candidatus Roizmanbacteria bacterium RIFOXYA2_FULL_38_14]OGK64211.1 MAG: hypothetical protein A3K27_05565 [Candidatus Roizmanbacteria bacterium RIFOXYA1_FULL_37_12]OGK66057.1 MAG: hypothetical protein A3K38_05565 [Candidatus Roizmanbacteria bacterium RIFOXYB1_FULL_40_23]OGK68524.1 MAG: hypothetical protein A2334_01495 [Candidatus Roizmanbacteria bacterium RIFOXYB2_FULL_38_10]OGK70462.1 MAG: hypothetical protein A3K21_05570 [Candidatus Roizmanbacteria ba
MYISKYKAIIFDFDETLVASYKVKWAQHQETAKRFYGVHLTEEKIRKYWGMPFEPMISIFYEHKDAAENMMKNYHSLDKLYHKKPYKDAISVLDFLHTKSYWLGLVTSMTKESVIQDMQESEMPYKNFDYIQGSKDSDHHKPDPRVFDYLIRKLERINIKRDETLYVGDDIRDMQAAMGAGLAFVAIPNGLTSKEEFMNNKAICIDTLSDLIVST